MAFVIVKNQEVGNVPTPASGKSTLFVDAADSLLKTKNSSGEVKTILDIGKALVVKGTINCSGNPKYPAAEAGHTYIVSAAGKIGGSSGEPVDIGDEVFCIAKAAEGTQAEVGTSWAITKGAAATAAAIKVERERAEASENTKLAKSSNLSDIPSATTARANIGALSQSEVETIIAGKGVLSKAEIEAIINEIGLTVFNVKHYGATGLGTGNDSLGIQAAVEAAEVGNGGIIFFPPVGAGKFYRLESKITYKLSKNIHFMGCGQASEIRILKDGEFGDCIIQERGTEEASGNYIKHQFINLWCRGPQGWPTSPSGVKQSGYPPSMISGIECPGNSIIKGCHMEGFYAGYFCREFSQKFEYCTDVVNLYGTYIGPNNLRQPFIKGGISRDYHASFPTWARLGVHPSYITEGAIFNHEDGSNEPYYFYKEAPTGVTGAFVQSAQGNQVSSQGTGNAVIYDENCASSLPAEYFKEVSNFGLQANQVNMINYPSTRIGNCQLLDTSGATAGTYKIVIPAQKGSGSGAGNQFVGVTTAAIAFNASNSTIQTALNTALSSISGSESTAVVSTREGKKQIWLTGKASLMAGTTMTLDISSLTGTASFGPLEMDPGMGPVIRPVAAKILTVKNATGGTFTVSGKIGGVEFTTAAIAYNATPQVVCERLWKAIGHPYGVVVGGASENGKYQLFFNGRSLNKTVELSVNTESLTGTSPEVTITTGTNAGLALRHAEYMIDGGKFELLFEDCPFTVNCGTVGFMRTKGELWGYFKGGFAGQLLTEIGNGEMIFIELGGSNHGFTLEDGKNNRYRLLKVTGEAKKNALLAVTGAQEAGVYPAGSTPPAAGFASGLVPAATTRRIPVRVSGTGSTSGSDASEPEYSGSAPAANVFLKPSTTEAGKVETGVGTDYTVGVSLAAGSGGKVKTQPRGLI